MQLFTEDVHHGKYEDRAMKKWLSTETTNKDCVSLKSSEPNDLTRMSLN